MAKKSVDISWVKDRASNNATATEDGGIFATVTGGNTSATRERRILLVDPTYLMDNPYQHRQDYKNLESLAHKMKQFGFRGSIPVRMHPTRPMYYEIAFGHRRTRAAVLAGITQIPVEAENFTDEQMILLAVSENYEREDLAPLEEGNGFLQMNEEFGMSQETIAEFVGEEKKEKIDRGYVRNRMRAAKLARLYPEVRLFLEQHPNVSMRAIGYLEEGLDERARNFILERLDQGNWTADNVAAAVKTLKAGGAEAEELLTPRSVADSTTAVERGELPAPEDTAGSNDRKGSRDTADLALIRTGILADVLKRLRRYARESQEALVSEDESALLSQISTIVEQRLTHS